MTTRHTLAIILTLLTGLVLGQLLTPSFDVQSNHSAQERSTLSAAGVFYESVNRYLESGDPAALADILDSGFVDHAAIESEPDTAGFVRYLKSLRAAYPDMRLDVDKMTPNGNLVAVAVAPTEGTAAIAGGFVPDRPPAPAGFEHLRIVNGRVAERWASGTLPPQYEQAAFLELRFLDGWFIESVMEQLTLAPGASETRRDFSQSLLIVTSGTLSMEIEPDGTPDAPQLLAGAPASPTPLELLGEQVVQIPEGATFRVWNTGEQPATAIIVEIQYRTPTVAIYDGHSYRLEPTDEIPRKPQVGLLPIGGGSDRSFALSLIRVAAAPNEVLPVHSVTGLEQLLVAEGTIEVERRSGIVSVYGPDGRGTVTSGEDLVLSPGDGLTASSNAALGYRVTAGGPATLWFVTLVSANPSHE